MVYLVQSDTGDTTYRVDLLAHGGKGQCSCRDWETRRSPAIRAGQQGPATRCKHVNRVREFFLNSLLEKMAQQETR